MIAWSGSAFLVIGFVVLFKLLRLLQLSRWTLEPIADALTVMGDRRLDDAARGSAMRRLAGRMLFAVAALVAGLAAALLLPAGVLLAADRLGLLTFDAILAVTLSPAFIVASSVLLIGAAFVVARRAPPVQTDSSYSFGEQLLHKLAFCTMPLQRLIASLEDRVLGNKLRDLDAERPIFITALPRAGTTLMLECCARLDSLATHRYRDMPFVTTPVLWARLSKRFQTRGEARERAHGDGMMIDFDSPEALEEVLWLASFRRPYRRDRILPFRPVPRDAVFKQRLQMHFRKLVYLRCGAHARSGRYVSKNNLNIARLGMLRSLFPECTIVVPFRDPVQHCLSLLRQHQRFLELHASDAFASEYMRQIGHFDFGENLCPVDFDGWLNQRQHDDTRTLGFWLEYWIAAYSNLLEHHAGHVNFFDYDGLCQAPEAGFLHLGRLIGLDEPAALAKRALDIRPARTHKVPHDEDVEALTVRAKALWERLKRASAEKVDPHAVLDKPEFARAAGAIAASERVEGGVRPEWKLTAAFAAVLLVFFGFLVGYRSVRQENALFRATQSAESGLRDLRDRLFGDGLPHAFLQPARKPGGGVLVGGDLADGKLILVSSFYGDRNELRLMRRDGSLVQRWPLSYFELFGDQQIGGIRPATEWNVDVHGIQIHPNGDVVLNFEYFGTVRLSRCGEVVFRIDHPTHHSLELAEGGGYWIPGRRSLPEGDTTYYPFVGPARVDLILKVDEHGKIVSEVAIPKIFENSGLTHILTASGETFGPFHMWDEEIVHVNKITELTADLAPAFPQFAVGDLLVSMRTYNLLMVVDPGTWRIKWHQTGPYIRQHDPSFTADGTITLFNNNTYGEPPLENAGEFRGSNVMQVDPKTGETAVLYGAREDQPLLSVIRSQVKPLPNGGLLIVEFGGGRVLEVDAQGKTVWEYVNRFNEQYVAEVTGARLLGPDDLQVSDWSCP